VIGLLGLLCESCVANYINQNQNDRCVICTGVATSINQNYIEVSVRNTPAAHEDGLTARGHRQERFACCGVAVAGKWTVQWCEACATEHAGARNTIEEYRREYSFKGQGPRSRGPVGPASAKEVPCEDCEKKTANFGLRADTSAEGETNPRWCGRPRGRPAHALPVKARPFTLDFTLRALACLSREVRLGKGLLRLGNRDHLWGSRTPPNRTDPARCHGCAKAHAGAQDLNIK
jgi:hypothetical protein